jgi:hypothetical protein
MGRPLIRAIATSLALVTAVCCIVFFLTIARAN